VLLPLTGVNCWLWGVTGDYQRYILNVARCLPGGLPEGEVVEQWPWVGKEQYERDWRALRDSRLYVGVVLVGHRRPGRSVCPRGGGPSSFLLAVVCPVGSW